MAKNGVDFGMTPQGFVPKRMANILDDLNIGIADIRDPDSGEYPFQNASDDSVLQQILGVMAEGLSECWEAAYDGAVQFDPLKNSGAGQAGTIQLNAMLLKSGSPTIINMELLGKNGAFVPQGAHIASSDSKYVFATTAPVYIGASGMAEVQAKCTVKGPVEPEPGEIMTIQTPHPGWLGAKNTSIVSLGSLQETETEARRRQQRSTSLTSYRQIESIYAAVYNIPGVIYCRAYQNSDTNPHDNRGIPFKEVAVVVEGGDPRAIAQALFLRFPIGIAGYGNTHEVFYDAQGVSYVVGFSRPEEIPIAVELDVTLTSRMNWPDTGGDLIKQAIVEYAQYGGVGNEDGFPPGTDIVCSRLYTPINSVAGHKVTRLEIARVQDEGESLFSTNDIHIAWNQVARFDPLNIKVNVTVE